MNDQTPAPLSNQRVWDIAEAYMQGGLDLRGMRDTALLAAAYDAFDKAGRALGVDATVLAQSIDLTQLIKIGIGNYLSAKRNGRPDDGSLLGNALKPLAAWHTRDQAAWGD